MKRTYIIAVFSVILSAAALAGIFMYPGSTTDAMPLQKDSGASIVANVSSTSPSMATAKSGNYSRLQKKEVTSCKTKAEDATIEPAPDNMQEHVKTKN
ncbi:MAG: hypothetical protein II952_02660 [Paludibacteraceae bacterium]|nr:hypothetical protein [Paludibacteraceae bacterium]